MGKVIKNGVELLNFNVGDVIKTSSISLLDNWAIGYSDTLKTRNPIDANNYVIVSGNTVTLKRNSAAYGLWIYSPLLTVGEEYSIYFESFSGDDGHFYFDWTTNIATNPITTTRIVNPVASTVINGITFKPATAGYYGILLWSSNTSDIVINNPRIICNTNDIYPTYKEYLYFNDECMRLPITLNSNHRIFCDFQLDNFVSQIQILGNTKGVTNRFYLGLWNGSGQNRIYCYNGSSELNTILSDYTTRHTLDFNCDSNHTIKIDTTSLGTGTITTDLDCCYTIGFRHADHRFIGKMYQFTIYDTTTGYAICHLRPATILGKDCMYDIVNNVYYYTQSA